LIKKSLWEKVSNNPKVKILDIILYVSTLTELLVKHKKIQKVLGHYKIKIQVFGLSKSSGLIKAGLIGNITKIKL